MNQAELLVVAMAEKCRSLILESPTQSQTAGPITRKRLLWMCDKIERNAESWEPTKLHRWIGFVQGGMLANTIVNINELRTMFDDAKIAHSELGHDLFDHLDPLNDFELEIGGES